MTKLLTTISIVSLLAITPALAQTSPQPGPAAPPTKSEPPAGMPDKAPMPDKSAPKAPGTSTEAPGARDTPAAKLAPASMGEHRASDLLNASVKNAAGESVGSINDLLIDSSGDVKAVIVGVGGFLGIGERNVALAFDQVQISRDANNRITVTANVSRERLKTAPEWKDPNAAASGKPAPTSPSPTSPKVQ